MGFCFIRIRPANRHENALNTLNVLYKCKVPLLQRDRKAMLFPFCVCHMVRAVMKFWKTMVPDYSTGRWAGNTQQKQLCYCGLSRGDITALTTQRISIRWCHWCPGGDWIRGHLHKTPTLGNAYTVQMTSAGWTDEISNNASPVRVCIILFVLTITKTYNCATSNAFW